MNRRAINGKTLFIFSGWLFVFFCAGNAFAQIDEAVIVKQKAQNTIRPKAKPAQGRVDIAKRVSIVRVEKKSRKNYKRPTAVRTKVAPKPVVRRIEIPLLAIQLKLLIVNADGSETEVNQLATFTPRDRLRLSIQTNQRGFLYIIRQRSPEEDGEIIFPTTLVNNGSNLVSAYYEYVIPNNCPKNIISNPRDCALELFSYEESPQEFFTLIFTRDQLVGLPDDVKNTRVSLANLMSAGKLQAKTLIDLIEDSGQDLILQPGDTPFAVRIINVNPKDNEEVIETFVLNKIKR